MLGFLKRASSLTARKTATRATHIAPVSMVDETTQLLSRIALTQTPIFSPLRSTQTRGFSTQTPKTFSVTYRSFSERPSPMIPSYDDVREKVIAFLKNQGLSDDLNLASMRIEDFGRKAKIHFTFFIQENSNYISEVNLSIDLENRHCDMHSFSSQLGKDYKNIGGKDLEHILLECAIYAGLLHNCHSFSLPSLPQFDYSISLGFKKIEKNGISSFILDTAEGSAIENFLSQIHSSCLNEVCEKIPSISRSSCSTKPKS